MFPLTCIPTQDGEAYAQPSRDGQAKKRSALIREAVEGAEMMRTLTRPAVFEVSDTKREMHTQIQIVGRPAALTDVLFTMDCLFSRMLRGARGRQTSLAGR